MSRLAHQPYQVKALYVNNEFKTHERINLKVKTKDYENVWIEIKITQKLNKKKRQTIT